MKDIQLNSILNIMARELDDFSQNWGGDPQTVPQRFDDLFTLVKSAKAVLGNNEILIDHTRPTPTNVTIKQHKQEPTK